MAQARDLKTGKTLPDDTARHMLRYFARHKIDKRAGNFGDDDNPSAGYVSRRPWGGEAGMAWAESRTAKLASH